MHHDEARTRLLDAADRLFYERGVQAVGMDELRAAAGVSLKRLYRCFPAKRELVEAYLRRRDERWRAALTEYVAAHAATPADRVLAVFDWLAEWFAGPGFRGCAFLNAYGELGAVSDGVAAAAHDHKYAVRGYTTGLAAALGAAEPEVLGGQLALLIDGAITTAALNGDPTAAHLARDTAAALLATATPAGS
ncbi:TetR/AcrR family transcriptional regulator [Streptomyces olivaceiscleroticus]|uniref:TetR/AcrR family transcriptional regulator n=1 Tax=Streptomyces olivaceiscleroticus TaxID=68245 RepID=A0ABP3JA74_9ACTN